MKVSELITLLLTEDPEQEVFFLNEEEPIKAYHVTKLGNIEGIPATILGTGECPNCKGE